MEKGIKLYVVRASFGAEVYASLDFAKEEVRNYLQNSSFNITVTIECWRSTQKITEGWQWISYGRQRIATREEFDNATEDGRLEFFAKNFAKNFGHGYMREDVYTFSVVSNRASLINTEFYGALNGRPTDTDFLKNQHHCNHWPLAKF